ncbi:MAG TPA: hypothetical protein VFC63_17380 [Blastocatellia bacterium]|nr:hypothetical protein [Blastocatellia bacterium]
MHHIEKETRRDRWYGLPYVLLAVMVLTGVLSYFLDYRYRQVNAVQPLKSASAKADEFIKRRIAEHDQAVKQATNASTTKAPVKPATPSTVALKMSKPATSQNKASLFSRAQIGAVISYLKRIPRKWMIGGAAAAAILILALFAFRGRKSREAQLLTNEPTNTPEEISLPNKSATVSEDPGLFSLYLGNDPTEDGSFVETYLKPTLSSLTDSIKAVFSRLTKRNETEEPMRILSSAMISAMPHSIPQTATATGNLFRRAVLVKK